MKLGEKEIGSQVLLRVDGVFTAFRVVHHGKPSDLYDSSWEGGTVLMLDYTETPLTMDMVSGPLDEKGTYATSKAHSELNSDYLSRLDTGVANLIREVKLPYRNDTVVDFTVASGENGLPAKVWLPSIVEVARGAGYLNEPYFYVEEGAVFDYWDGADPEQYELWQCTDENDRELGWGTRTPNSYSSGSVQACFNVIYGSGICYNHDEDTVKVWPCLVLPDEVTVDNDGYIFGGRVVYTKVGGTWCEGAASTKVDGVWKELSQLAVKVGGAWKE